MAFNNILTISQIIQSENEFIKKNPSKNIMDIAAKKIWTNLSKIIKKERTLFISGPGKNGIDGKKVFELAKKSNFNVKLIDLSNKKVSKEIERKNKEFKSLLNSSSFVIDAIFGVGINRNVKGNYKRAIININSFSKSIISIDLPSGINADSGLIKGQAIKADLTLCIGFYKPAHFLLPSKKYCGDLKLIDIGLKLSKRKPNIKVITSAIVKKKIPSVSIDIHKYQKGNVLVFAGSMSGASRLVALASRKVGAGLSTINVPEKYSQYYLGVEPGTIMNFEKNLKISKFNVLVIGPGLGLASKRKNILKKLKNKLPVVLDADAISVFEKKKSMLIDVLKERKNTILTPHHGEFKKLFNFKDQNKISLTLKAAKESSSIVIYKGNDSVIACPNGNVWVNNNAKNNLATAGTGDILSGLIAGLLSQKVDLEFASILAVWIHGKLSHNVNNVIAEDFINEIPKVLETIKK